MLGATINMELNFSQHTPASFTANGKQNYAQQTIKQKVAGTRRGGIC